MKNEIFKVSFAKYQSEKFKDCISLDEPGLGFLELRETDSRHPHFVREKSFDDEKTFVENFGNPLYSVLRNYTMIVIEEKGDNISLKIFWGGKDRRVGKVWFSRSKNVEFLTVNRKTGDFYFGHLHNYQKKKKFFYV